MGDPKRLRKQYTTPNHPWQKARIDEEIVLMKEYGMKNKKELWKMASILKNYKERVKSLVPRHDKQAEVERTQLMAKVESLGLVKPGSRLEDVLSLSLKELMERRLQTVVFKKGLCTTIRQARQYVTHEHIYVDNKMVNSPSYLVSLKEEGLIKVSEQMSALKETEPTPEAI